MIEVNNFEKWYKDFAAVRGLSFKVPKGAIVAMVGPNGAGKTTTIRTLCGILRPTRGSLKINGLDVATQPVEVKRCTAYVPDDPALFESLTIWEHLRFVAESHQLKDWEMEANELLQRFELLDKKQSLASELSRGMRQKVALACAYIRHPSVLLLDEPMTGLDPSSIRTLKETFREQTTLGTTLLISSHLLDIVGDLCDHLILMRQGTALFDGPMSDAKQRFGGETSSLEEVFFYFNSSNPPIASNADRL